MPTTTPEPPPIPNYDEPFIDPQNGRITPRWYKWLVFYDRIWRQLRKEIP
jgi:hypothetical protein